MPLPLDVRLAGYLNLTVGALSLAFGFLATYWLARRFPARFQRENFASRVIPAAFGLAYVLAADAYYSFRALLPTPYYQRLPLIYLLVSVGFGALGLADDLAGDRTAGGFLGHFRKLFRERRLTTGAVKAIGGGILALIAGWLLAGPSVYDTIIAALMIALTANTANLLDLRPGRCLAAFFAGAIAVVATLAAHHLLRAGELFYFALLAAALLYPLDSRGRVMLGDTGANSLGATLGLTMALFFSPVWRIVAIALLAIFHIWAEKRSLTKLIEETPVLRRIDRKIGIR